VLVVAGVVSIVVASSSDIWPSCVTGRGWDVVVVISSMGTVGSPIVPVRVTATANSITDGFCGARTSDARCSEVSTLSSKPWGGAGVSIPESSM